MSSTIRLFRGALLAVAIVTILGAVGLASLFFISPELRTTIELHISHRDYLNWKHDGGDFKSGYHAGLTKDRNRNDMIAGLSYEDIISKYTNLRDGEDYPEDSYKGEYLRSLKQTDPSVRILWLNPEDSFDWCFVVSASGSDIRLIKG